MENIRTQQLLNFNLIPWRHKLYRQQLISFIWQTAIVMLIVFIITYCLQVKVNKLSNIKHNLVQQQQTLQQQLQQLTNQVRQQNWLQQLLTNKAQYQQINHSLSVQLQNLNTLQIQPVYLTKVDLKLQANIIKHQLNYNLMIKGHIPINLQSKQIKQQLINKLQKLNCKLLQQQFRATTFHLIYSCSITII